MFVKRWTKTNIVSIGSNNRIEDARDLMLHNRIKAMPVLDSGKLVGVVSMSDISKVLAPEVTTINLEAIKQLLATRNVADIMVENFVSIDADRTIGWAAVMMRNFNISFLPVLENGAFYGIITKSGVLDAFIEILGFKETGPRFVFSVKAEPGELLKVINIISKSGGNILSIATCRSVNRGEQDVFIKADMKVDTIVEDLKEHLPELNYRFKFVS
jgi:acetoin utilization protein AcuB